MFIEPWPNLKFDPHGDNPDNDIAGEVQKLDDKTCPWIVPNGAPFVKGSVKIETLDGQPIKTGWKEVLCPTPLVEMTGLEMFTFIEIDESILSLDQIVISYHSVGAYFIPRSTLEDQLEAIEHGSEPIPWSKVIQIPATLPPEEHWHAITELMDWEDVVLYLRYISVLTKRYQDSQKTIVQIFADVKTVMDNVVATYNIIYNKLLVHGGDQSNPHGVTAFDLFLGNIDNFATATVVEDVAGLRSDLFSTPAGAVAAVIAQSPDTSAIMKSGTLPISLLSSSDYIPPVIDGSFEGMGTDQNAAAICLENNGRLVIVRRHFDGRNRNLYYTFITDYKNSAKAKIEFTGFVYSNAKLEQQGYTLDTVMPGSGSGVMVVGDSVKGKWFAALTNGTLNHETHTYTELNVSNIQGINFDQQFIMHCIKTRDYVIIVGRDRSYASSKRYFYRAPVSAFTGAGVVSFTQFNVSFTTKSGINFSNSPYWVPDVRQTDANGKVTRFLHNFTPAATVLNEQYNDPLVAMEDTPNKLIIKFTHRPYANCTDFAPIKFLYYTYETVYSLDVTTGAMVLLKAQPIQTVNWNDLTGSDISSSAFVGTAGGAAMAFGFSYTQEGVAVMVSNTQTTSYFPGILGVLYNADYSPKEFLQKLWLNAGPGVEVPLTYFTKSMGFEGPLQSGVLQSTPCWDAQGELYSAMDRAGVTVRKAYKKISGAYAVRQGVTNLTIPEVLGRPLTNAVYQSNLHQTHQMVGITGTPAELTAAGVEMGVMGGGAVLLQYKPTGWMLRAYPDTKGLIDQHYNNHKFSWPDQMTKTFDEDNLTVDFTPTSYFAIDDAALAKLLSLLDASGNNTRGAGFCISLPAAAKGNLSRGIPENEGFIYMAFASTGNTQLIGYQIAYCRFTFVQDGTARVITDITVLTRTPLSTTANQSDSVDFSINQQGLSTCHNYFRNGNKISHKSSVGMVIAQTGGAVADKFFFDFDIPTKTFSNLDLGNIGYGAPGNRTIIPGVGFGINQTLQITGGAAHIAKSDDNDKYYMLGSAYPDSGWIIYFKSGTRLVINGAEYDAPIGTVDLRDIDPNPQNKTFYVYATAYGDEAQFIVSGRKIRHNLSMVPAAEVVTSSTQIITITRFTTFMIGDGIVSAIRKAGTIPQSTGMPMDEGTLSYVYQSDLI